jgi:hypothetical protein
MMDVLTERGQQSVADEQQAVRIFNAHWPDITYCHTPKKRECNVDAVLMRQQEIIGVVETKCRYDMTHQDFILSRGGEWLVTFDKLCAGRDIALSLTVPLIGFLYIVQDRVLLVKSITDSHGKWIAEMSIKVTETQATINGGRAQRCNAYVKFADAKQYKESL